MIRERRIWIETSLNGRGSKAADDGEAWPTKPLSGKDFGGVRLKIDQHTCKIWVQNPSSRKAARIGGAESIM